MKESQGEVVIGILWFILAGMMGDHWASWLVLVGGFVSILHGLALSYKEKLIEKRKDQS